MEAGTGVRLCVGGEVGVGVGVCIVMVLTVGVRAGVGDSVALEV